jgi:DNA-binding beta-propeller fold protein YncE
VPSAPGTPINPTEYSLPNGWQLRPAGSQVVTERAPTGVTVAPDGTTAYVVTSGIFTESMTVVDTQSLRATPVPAPSLFMGVGQDQRGNVWAASGFSNRVLQFKHQGPVAVPVRHVSNVPGSPDRGIPVIAYPGNLVVDGTTLYVTGTLSVPTDYIAGKQMGASCPSRTENANGKRVCSVLSIVDVSDAEASTPPVRYVPVGRDAYGVAVNTAQHMAYVTNWGDETATGNEALHTGTVSVIDLAHPGGAVEVQVVRVGHHPTGIALSPDRSRVVVANSSDDTISVIPVDGADGSLGSPDTESVGLSDDGPRGATPIAVTFSARYLFIGLAGQNAVQVRELDGAPIPRAGLENTYIPTGWYPSALATHDSRLYVANLKGMGSGPGLNGQASPLMGSRTQGTLSVINVDDAQLDAFTQTVKENNRWALLSTPGDAANNPCATVVWNGGTAHSQLLCDAAHHANGVDPSTLHVVYVIKENKTFDQYFGDLKPTLADANADPTWLLYGEAVTTNQHNLARRYALSDAFTADSEQSTTGHSWTSAGYVTEHNEITWNPEYSEGFRGSRGGGQYEGNRFIPGASDPDTAATEGALFDPPRRLVDAMHCGVPDAPLSCAIYSDDINAGSPAIADRVPLGKWGIGASAVHHGRDLDFPDTDRASLFLDGETVSHAWSVDSGPPGSQFMQPLTFTPEEKAKFSLSSWTTQYTNCITLGGTDAECQKTMPNFIYMALPIDHTIGFNPLTPTPASMVADNDYATGRIIEGLSNSPFWKNTIVFITEDDTQLAGDHVDAHRTFLLTAGGLARTLGADNKVSHQPGSFPSVLKTIEVLFGTPPLSVYDRGAAPLHDVVVDAIPASNADTLQYVAVRPPTPFLTNPSSGPMAAMSQRIDWRLDHGDPSLVTALIYHGIRGWPLPTEVKARLTR